MIHAEARTNTQVVSMMMDAQKTMPGSLWDIAEHKEQRSQKANRYFHRLVGLLAKGEKTAFYKKKNELIMQYGNQKYEYGKDGILKCEYLLDDDSYKRDPIKHYQPTQYVAEFKPEKANKSVMLRAFLLLAGTHTYNSVEMAYLIDCTRNECAGCGIPWETIETPEEKHLMEQMRQNARKDESKPDQ